METPRKRYADFASDFTPDLLTFKGNELTEADLPRLNTHARKVWDAMILASNTSYSNCIKVNDKWIKCDGGWVELNELARLLDISHSSLSACVRAFRYDENGGHTVETKRAEDGKGTWLYKLVPNTLEGCAAARARASAKKQYGGSEYSEGYTAGVLAARSAVVAATHNTHGWFDVKGLVAVIDKLVTAQTDGAQKNKKMRVVYKKGVDTFNK